MRPHWLCIPLVWLAACAPPASETAGDPAAIAAMRREADLRVADSAVLREGLQSTDGAVRKAAARGMGRIQEPAYAGALEEALTLESDPEVAKAIYFALGQMGLVAGGEPPPEAVRAILAALDGPSVAEAAKALGKLAPEGAAPRLLPALSHSEAEARRQGAYALFRTRFVPVWRGDQEEPPELPEAAVQGLIERLRTDSEPEVRRAAAYAFSRYGQPDAVPALVESFGDADLYTRLFAVRAVGQSGEGVAGDDSAVGALLSALADPEHGVRYEAVQALDKLGAADRLPRELTSDPWWAVRAAAAQAWAGVQNQATLEALAELAQDPSPNVAAAAVAAVVARREAGYVENLEQALSLDSWILRAGAVQATAALEPWEARPSVEAGLADPDRRVQAAAAAQVGRLTDADELIAGALAADDLAVRGMAVGSIPADHPRRLSWLTEAYEASAGEDWIEVREGVVAALEGTEGGLHLLRKIAAEDEAPSVRAAAIRILEQQGEEMPAVAPPPIEASVHLTGEPQEAVTVILETSKGEIHIQTLPDDAQIHVASFVERVRAGFYDGLIWHRVVPNFVIQGGDPRGDGWGGDGPTLRDEINPVPYRIGAVGMPKAGKDTGTCQIFISQIPTPHLDGNYTVFGQMTSGWEALQAIEVGDRIERAYVRE